MGFECSDRLCFGRFILPDSLIHSLVFKALYCCYCQVLCVGA